MGAILCCLRGPDDGCCSCCLPWALLDNTDDDSAAADAARQRADTPLQVTVTLAAGSTGSGQVDSLHSFPRPPPRPWPSPYDDPRSIRQMEKRPLVKASTTQLQRANDQPEGSNNAGKAGGSSLRAQPSEGRKIGGTTQVDVPSECQEDDCPICLEEYDYENPRMELQCGHGFHLGCIFEWMERSQSCPLCAKVMLFHEDQ